jgi:tRNA isopentenyl-2-thiomethyl-A-37 hydroxylase MiaE
VQTEQLPIINALKQPTSEAWIEQALSICDLLTLKTEIAAWEVRRNNLSRTVD